eukprot:COSAG02_NODE_3538_length_6591_cov_2.343038_7_plen_153_part_00
MAAPEYGTGSGIAYGRFVAILLQERRKHLQFESRTESTPLPHLLQWPRRLPPRQSTTPGDESASTARLGCAGSANTKTCRWLTQRIIYESPLQQAATRVVECVRKRKDWGRMAHNPAHMRWQHGGQVGVPRTARAPRVQSLQACGKAGCPTG